MRTGWIIAFVSAIVLAGCASSPGGGPPGQAISLAGGLVAVPVHSSFEITEEPGRDGGPERVALRRESRIRGSFESCTVSVTAIPVDSLQDLTAAEIASRLAARLYQTQTEASGLHDIRLMSGQRTAGQSVPHDVVEWSYTIERTMRARERYWGLASGDQRWVTHQNCTTVASPADLLALEAATAPVFSPG